MTQWLHEHKFKIHLTTFSLMIISSIALYLTIDKNATGAIWIFMAIFSLANIAAMFTK